MHFSLIFCHWKTGMMSAYTVAQLLKYKGNHELDIYVVDNNDGDGTIKYLDPFLDQITVVPYPKDRLQSHGIGIDYIMSKITTEAVITVESDSFPTREGWLDEYAGLIEEGVDCAGSMLDLSGGTYTHPCGMLFRKSNWELAAFDCAHMPYLYFPNMAMKEDFACHLMVHENTVQKFLETPEKYITLADGYKPYTKELAIKKGGYYSPSTYPFHNGMGGREESVRTYGQRTPFTDSDSILAQENIPIIRRIGYEPGQFFSYWHFKTGKIVVNIPTETKWLFGKAGQQQEYTMMDNGFKHIWGISAWKDGDPENEFAKVKQPIPAQLYATLPAHQKISE